MLCLSCYSAFRVLVLNLIVSAVNLIINAIAFSSNQWAVSDSETDGCKTYVFIGLMEAKVGTSGCADDDFSTEDIDDCDDIGLDGGDCDTYESAVETAQAALACVVLILIYKGLLLWMAHCNNHNRILWLLMIVCAGADIIFGSLAFAACGNWQTILEELPSISSDPSLGFGWGLELLSGLIAYITAAFAVLVLIKGIGENADKPAEPAPNAA